MISTLKIKNTYRDLIEYWMQEDRYSGEKHIMVIYKDRYSKVRPWCIEYDGTGYYFQTRDELDEYCQCRGWGMTA